jgi:phosphoribosylaminoimidazole-succinocarboxamide synthase
VRKCRVVPVECVARGYLVGSGLKEYNATGRVCGIELEKGLTTASKLREPIFTPATKEESGHDINISEDEAAKIIGRALTDRLKALTLAIFERGCDHAESKGIIIADTKFEFGLVGDGNPATDVVLIDEVLTPDSSRFWPKDQYQPGGAVPSFDKQFVRDYLEEITWNKQPPVPSLPDRVVAKTRDKYVEAFRRLSGRELV